MVPNISYSEPFSNFELIFQLRDAPPFTLLIIGRQPARVVRNIILLRNLKHQHIVTYVCLGSIYGNYKIQIFNRIWNIKCSNS